MYICICNAITEEMLKKDPSLKEKIGTNCGICISPNNTSKSLRKKKSKTVATAGYRLWKIN
jgi:bacterioferritin-associated ferredoxin